MKLLLKALLVLGFSGILSAGTVVEDALLTDRVYEISGIFGEHDFIDASDAFDWAFTTSAGVSYQLQGIAPTDNDVFGWKKVTIPMPLPKWYMFQLNGDIDGDNSAKFDWVLASTNTNSRAMYKLKGVSDTGNFEYSSKLNVDYKVNENFILTGSVGDFTTSTFADVLSPFIGQALYSNECGDIVLFTFRDDGKLLIQEGDEELLMEYSMKDDILYTVGEENETHTLLSYDSELVKILESNGEVTTLYFSRSDAEASEPEGCDDGDNGSDDNGDTSDDTAIHHIEISPYPLAIGSVGDTIVFTATAVDRNGNVITPQPEFVWSTDNDVAIISTSAVNSQNASVIFNNSADGSCAIIFVTLESGEYEASSHVALSGTTEQYPCPPEQ